MLFVEVLEGGGQPEDDVAEAGTPDRGLQPHPGAPWPNGVQRAVDYADSAKSLVVRCALRRHSSEDWLTHDRRADCLAGALLTR